MVSGDNDFDYSVFLVTSEGIVATGPTDAGAAYGSASAGMSR